MAIYRESCPREGCGRPSLRNPDTGQLLFQCDAAHSWWAPNPGPQTNFLSRKCFEVLYGGAAGGGKSVALLVDAIRYVGKGYGSAYHAVLFRRTYPELKRTLIKEAFNFYPSIGGKYNTTDHVWRFPGGEIVEFASMEHDDDRLRYQGVELQFVGFDELTHFLESQYLYLFSRLRSSRGVPLRMRAASNPGGDGHDWVFKRWGSWLNPESTTRTEIGKTLWFLRDSDGVDNVVAKGTRLARDRTFIGAKLEDNPALFTDGQYEAGLATLDPVEHARLRGGNWLIKPARGLYFQRGWFSFCNIDEVPRDVKRCRYWDRAATEVENGKAKDPDWTAGSRIAYSKELGKIYIEDMARDRLAPGDVEAFIQSTAEIDGRGVLIGLEQEPGASGKSEIAAYMRRLNGWRVVANPKRVNKVVAAGPLSSQAVARNVVIVRGHWNEALISELEQFPEGSHDDQVDACSGGHSLLAGAPPPPARGVGQTPIGLY